MSQQNRSQINEILKRLAGKRLGDNLKKEGIPKDAILNKNYEQLQHFQIWAELTGTIDLPIVKMGMQALLNLGRSKAIGESNIITQISTFLSATIKDPGIGIGSGEDDFVDDSE